MVAWPEVMSESKEVDRFNYILDVELLGSLDMGLREKESRMILGFRAGITW